MRAGDHHSDFKLGKECENELAITEATPFNCSARGSGAKLPYIVQGVVTTIPTVLTPATGIKI